MRDNLALAQRISQLEADPPISLGSVDLTIADPDRLRVEFDEVFHYFALVEGEVAQNAADVVALLPDLDDDDRRFLSAWSVHEAAHSAVFDAIRAELALPSSAPSGPSAAKMSFRGAGALARFPWLHDILKHVYLARGAMHERLTYDAYAHLGSRLVALNETGLARTVTEPIQRQEARHLGYYRAAAAIQRRRLTETQLRWARVISVSTYTPVGATRPRRALCGRVFSNLAGDDIDRVLDAVEGIAGTLLSDGLRTLPRFVHRAMSQCLGDGADGARRAED